MKSKKLSLVIPIMGFVGFIAFWMLNTGYPEIALPIRLFIVLGAVLLSGVISYFLFPENEGKR